MNRILFLLNPNLLGPADLKTAKVVFLRHLLHIVLYDILGMVELRAKFFATHDYCNDDRQARRTCSLFSGIVPIVAVVVQNALGDSAL